MEMIDEIPDAIDGVRPGSIRLLRRQDEIQIPSRDVEVFIP